jgi:CCR4-NOT transcriptional complex subunit CAF120
MTAWSSNNSDTGPNSPTRISRSQTDLQTPPRRPLPSINTATPPVAAQQLDSLTQSSPAPSSPGTPSRARADSRATYRPESMVQTYQPQQVDVSQDTPPELAPIFSYLNSHSNKLYQEGYFLKLHDLDSRGRPSSERTWTECFAQLVGTVLSLWDAAALDAAGEDGEVVPTFINLSDASLKMVSRLLAPE